MTKVLYQAQHVLTREEVEQFAAEGMFDLVEERLRREIAREAEGVDPERIRMSYRYEAWSRDDEDALVIQKVAPDEAWTHVVVTAQVVVVR